MGAADIHESRAEKLIEAHALEDVETGTDVDGLLNRLQPEILFDLTPPENRVTMLEKALEYGCHVLSEKPMATSLADAKKMIALANETGKIYAVIQNRRFDPSIRRLSRFVSSGVIGKPTTVHCDFFVGAHINGFQDRMQHPLLLDMAIHTFDQARLISGADAKSVYCHEWNPDGSWFDHHASAIAIFEMTNGIVFCYRGSWCSEGFRTSWQSDWRVIGSEGTARWDGEKRLTAEAVRARNGYFSEVQRVWISRRRKSDRVGGHAGVIRDFEAAVRSGGVPETAGADNLKSLAMVFAAIESTETKRRIDILT